MKKIFLLLLIILTMSGCGSSDKNNDTVKIGTLTQLNTTQENAAKISNGGAINFYDNFNSMQMALQAKKIDVIQTYDSVAKYMIANNPDFKVNESQTVKLVDNFCCAMREGDTDLKNSFDAAISAMNNDGTLNKLVETYIKNFKGVPSAVAIAKIEGADTIKVGITGDLPPLDLVLADGTPAGFNTAVLSEISKRVGKNIELVQIDSSSRAAALTSGQVDVVFWVVVPDDNSNRPKDFDKPEGVTVTNPYYQDVVVDVNLSSFDVKF